MRLGTSGLEAPHVVELNDSTKYTNECLSGVRATGDMGYSEFPCGNQLY